MRILFVIIIFLHILTNFSFAKEELFDNPIDYDIEKACKVSEYCQMHLDNYNLEEYIKNEFKNEYILLSLDECIDIALKNNFDMQIKLHEYRSSKYLYQNTLAQLLLPDFNSTSYIADYSGQILVGGVLNDRFHETAVSVNLTVEHDLTRGGEEYFKMKAARYFAKSKQHREKFTKTEVIYLSARYYYEMVLAKISIEIYLRNLIERNAQLALTKNLESSGFGTHFDVIRAQNFSSEAKTKLLNALNQFRISQTKLAKIMGIDVKTPLMPIESDVEKLNLIDDEQEVQNLFKLALNNREDLKEYQDLIKYEREVKKTLITEFIPKPLVNYQQQFQGTLSTSVRPNYVIAGFVNWQPGSYLGVGTITKIKAQQEKIKTRQLEFKEKLRNIYESIINSTTTSQFSKKQININKQRIEYTNESVNLAMLRFNNGKGILLDVIQAQNEVINARVQLVSSIINYNIAQLQTLFNLGTINKEDIVKKYAP